jgi:hypothetical protein
MDLLADTITQQVKEDPDVLVHAEDYKSPHYGVLNGKYWERFEPLEPIEQKITQAVRQDMDVH